ncbi:type VI secretion protein, family [Piscirickettsia salmonis]|uniref:type VI secretion system baseplate subunit TssK n=1 Tax=Piscirickettsia salmonis TaxID=1238 RepID=UPI0012B83AF8|nr:type VI secretion system baseplate subunit TssK [Piscirickettsia salmonis]QGP50416.1 type VI secretion protein, family [Piscirickettsia salmonis]
MLKPKWYNDQYLYPEHFECLTEYLMVQQKFGNASYGIPDYGLLDICWSEAEMQLGILKLTCLRLLTHEGEYIDIDKNSIVNSIDLNEIDKERISIYINLGKSEEVYKKTENGKVILLKEKVIVSDKIIANSKFTMKIFDLDKKVDGEFKVSDNFIAPSLSIATQCFNKVEKIINKLIQELKLYSKKKSLDASPSYRSLIKLLINDLMFFLVNAKNSILCHPIYLFQYLTRVYVLVAEIDSLNSHLLTYSHDNFAISFNNLTSLIFIELARKLNKFTHIDYYVENHAIFSKTLDISDDSDLILIMKEKYIKQVKICAPSRINTIISRSLSGASLVEQDKYRGVFNERSGYKSLLIKKDYEFEYIKKDKKLSLLNYPILDGNDLAIIKV